MQLEKQAAYYLDCESHDWRRYVPDGKFVDKRHIKMALLMAGGWRG